MRVSAFKGDPGYKRWNDATEAGLTVQAYLDGVRQDKCLTADSDEGFVDRCVVDKNGQVQIDPNKPGEIWIERVEGDVRIEIA